MGPRTICLLRRHVALPPLLKVTDNPFADLMLTVNLTLGQIYGFDTPVPRHRPFNSPYGTGTTTRSNGRELPCLLPGRLSGHSQMRLNASNLQEMKVPSQGFRHQMRQDSGPDETRRPGDRPFGPGKQQESGVKHSTGIVASEKRMTWPLSCRCADQVWKPR